MTKSDGIERDEDILSYRELSEYIGVGRNTLYKLVKYNLIPWYKPVRMRLYFIRGEIKEWLKYNQKYNRNDIKL